MITSIHLEQFKSHKDTNIQLGTSAQKQNAQ